LVAGRNAVFRKNRQQLQEFPKETMIGALCHYVTHAAAQDFQPMKANFGIMPPLESKQRMNKRQRAAMYSERSLQKLESFLSGAEK